MGVCVCVHGEGRGSAVKIRVLVSESNKWLLDSFKDKKVELWHN